MENGQEEIYIFDFEASAEAPAKRSGISVRKLLNLRKSTRLFLSKVQLPEERNQWEKLRDRKD